MMTSYHRNRFLLTQNNVLNVNRKSGSANPMAPLSSVCSERFCDRGKCWVLTL